MAEGEGQSRRGPGAKVLVGALACAVLLAGLVALVRPWNLGKPAPQMRKPSPAARSVEPALPPVEIAADPAHKIAFARQVTGGLFHIHVINADGTGEATLTFGPGEERDPAWSPDRTRIAFVRRVNPADPVASNADIYVMRADGSGSSRLTEGPGEEGDPSWSPDGTRIAFFMTDPATRRRHISVRRVDGARQIELSDPPDRCNDREPTWSPDGLRLVFVRKCGDAASALYVMGADGKRLLLLTDFGRTPDWSPDGAKIVYTGLGIQGPSVYVMNPDGSGKTKLTESLLSGDPEWSPDGTRIVFAGSDLATVHLFIMNADGGQVRRLTSDPSEDVTASW